MPANGVVDVLIAGQGAAAYAAALYAARYQLEAVVVGDRFGGETAIGGTIENYPGQPEIDGFDLMLKFKEQVDKYGVPIIDAMVTAIEPGERCLDSQLSDGSSVRSGAVILAIGRERRKLGLAHEEEWTGKGVSYCSTCDAPLYRDRVVAVVGGGNAAVEGAILNAKYASEVLLIYRGATLFRPEPVLVDLLNESAVRVLFRTEVRELIGDEESGLSAIRISPPHDDRDVLRVDGVFIEIGADPRVALAERLGVDLNPETNEVHVDRLMKTNVDGVFAAGDLTDSSGPLKQTVTAASQGAIAALSAYQYVAADGRRCWRHEKGFQIAVGADSAD